MRVTCSVCGEEREVSTNLDKETYEGNYNCRSCGGYIRVWGMEGYLALCEAAERGGPGWEMPWFKQEELLLHHAKVCGPEDIDKMLRHALRRALRNLGYAGSFQRCNHDPVHRGPASVVCREAVEKLGYCEQCGSVEDLEGHHIVPVEFGGEPIDRSNIEVLCYECHRAAHRHITEVIEREWGSTMAFKNLAFKPYAGKLRSLLYAR